MMGREEERGRDMQKEEDSIPTPAMVNCRYLAGGEEEGGDFAAPLSVPLPPSPAATDMGAYWSVGQCGGRAKTEERLGKGKLKMRPTSKHARGADALTCALL
jgi:hypothetical protein